MTALLSEKVWAISTFLILIYFVIITYFSIKFFIKRNEALYQKRYAIITVYESLFCVLHLIFVLLYQSMNGIKYFLNTDTSLNTYNLIKYFAYFGHLVSMQFVFYLLIVRFYLLRYDLKLIALLQKNEWKRIINPNYTNQLSLFNDKDDIQLNWYYNNKYKYGFNYISCRIILCCLIPTSFIGPLPYCIMSLLYGKNADITITGNVNCDGPSFEASCAGVDVNSGNVLCFVSYTIFEPCCVSMTNFQPQGLCR